MNYSFNDGGKSKSKRPKQKFDCVVRSIAIALNKNYDTVYEELAVMGRKCGRGTPKDIWKEYLAKLNLIQYKFPAQKGVARMNLFNFVSNYTQGNYIVQMAGHLTAVCNGIVQDEFMPDEDRCVYAAWKVI